MKRLLLFSLLLVSLACFSKSKKIVVAADSWPDSTIVRFKNGDRKKISTADFKANYEVRLQYYPGATVVSGSSEPLCLGGWVYLTNSRTDADFIVKETSANDYDCAIRIVDKSSPDCDEWRITSERALAKHKVYIAPQNELGYDYKVRIIR
ncbi:MAG: hypothetical protein E7073_05715 [Bacteroidales bacterium]|nr:hypothetical protein [Bacteroidales bacterium]